MSIQGPTVGIGSTAEVSTEQKTVTPATHKSKSAYYRPELDMLRLFAFLAVFFAHAVAVNMNSGAFARWPGFLRAVSFVHSIGGYGLPLFFFLSSFLITTLLILEKKRTGAVHIRNFYIRRILRIWPLYLAFVMVCFLAGELWSPIHFSGDVLVAYLLISANWYLMAVGPATGAIMPLWSISIEEQFYLLWPALVSRLSIAGIRNVCAILFVLSLVCTGILGAAHVTFLQLWLNSGAQMVFFAGGALLALQIGLKEQKKSALISAINVVGGVLLWMLALYIGGETAEWQLTSPRSVVLSYLLVCLGCACLLNGVLYFPSTWIRSSLVYLGRISYGLYVFHGLALEIGRHEIGSHLRGGSWIAVSLAITVAAAIPSYEFYEKPFLKLKRRFEFVRSRPVADSEIAPKMPG